MFRPELNPLVSGGAPICPAMPLSFNSEEMFQQCRELLASVPNILDEVYETAEMIRTFTPEDIDYAVAFYENQVFSFSSTGKSFAIKVPLVNCVLFFVGYIPYPHSIRRLNRELLLDIAFF